MFIEFDGIINVRDLGGISAAGGKTVKPGLLLRGAGLNSASDRDIERLSELGVAHIVDFRDPVELEALPDPELPFAAYHSLPALPGLPSRRAPTPETVPVPDFDGNFRRIYVQLASGEEAARAYRGFFDVLLEGRGAYWHCTQGKDRTGVAAILLLTALGSPTEEIMEDYYLSNTGLRHMYEQPWDGPNAWSDETRAKLFFVWPEFVANFFDETGRLWGGVDGYLRRRLGLTEAEMERLRGLYTE